MNYEQFKPHIVHTLEEVRGFFGPYRFLSNFHPCTITYEGITFENSESAYQSAKTLHINEREMFRLMTGQEAKEAGRKITLRPDWEKVKDTVMFDVLCHKFLSNDELFDALKNTGEAYLEETNWWGDTYWGVAVPSKDPPVIGSRAWGHNQLGKILMMIRTILI